MSFALRWTPTAKESFDRLQQDAARAAEGRKKTGKKKASKQEGLFKQVAKALERLGQDPRHPSLQTHEFHSLDHPYEPKGKVFEAYAQQHTPGAYRIFWCYGPRQREVTIIAITPHP